MKLVRLLFENGYLTDRGADLLGVLGILMVWSAAYIFPEWSGIWFWIIILVGGVFGYLSAYGGLARVLGLSAPFSKDPLGWRDAKKSYNSAKDQEEES